MIDGTIERHFVDIPCDTCKTLVMGVASIFTKYPVNCDACIAIVNERIAATAAASAAATRRGAALVTARHNPAPPRYVTASLLTAVRDPDNAKAVEVAERFARAIIDSASGVGIDGIGFYSPGYGTGKTHIAWGIVNDLRTAGCGAMLYTVGSMLDAITSTFGDEERHAWLAHALRSVAVLVLDDFGKEFAREESWSAMEVFEVIRDRYDRMLPVVFTTNFEPSQLRERAQNHDKERAIIDRNLAITWLECKGQTRRAVNSSWL